MMAPCISEVWRRAGGVWKAINSRIVLAQVKLEGERGTNTSIYATILSVYVPMYHSVQERKDEFYADLQSTLDGVHEGDVLLLLGDFNARVGSSRRQHNNSGWAGKRLLWSGRDESEWGSLLCVKWIDSHEYHL